MLGDLSIPSSCFPALLGDLNVSKSFLYFDSFALVDLLIFSPRSSALLDALNASENLLHCCSCASGDLSILCLSAMSDDLIVSESLLHDLSTSSFCFSLLSGALSALETQDSSGDGPCVSGILSTLSPCSSALPDDLNVLESLLHYVSCALDGLSKLGLCFSATSDSLIVTSVFGLFGSGYRCRAFYGLHQHLEVRPMKVDKEQKPCMISYREKEEFTSEQKKRQIRYQRTVNE
jgi:hypothetical protein